MDISYEWTSEGKQKHFVEYGRRSWTLCEQKSAYDGMC